MVIAIVFLLIAWQSIHLEFENISLFIQHITAYLSNFFCGAHCSFNL